MSRHPSGTRTRANASCGALLEPLVEHARRAGPAQAHLDERLLNRTLFRVTKERLKRVKARHAVAPKRAADEGTLARHHFSLAPPPEADFSLLPARQVRERELLVQTSPVRARELLRPRRVRVRAGASRTVVRGDVVAQELMRLEERGPVGQYGGCARRLRRDEGAEGRGCLRGGGIQLKEAEVRERRRGRQR